MIVHIVDDNDDNIPVGPDAADRVHGSQLAGRGSPRTARESEGSRGVVQRPPKRGSEEGDATEQKHNCGTPASQSKLANLDII